MVLLLQSKRRGLHKRSSILENHREVRAVSAHRNTASRRCSIRPLSHKPRGGSGCVRSYCELSHRRGLLGVSVGRTACLFVKGAPDTKEHSSACNSDSLRSACQRGFRDAGRRSSHCHGGFNVDACPCRPSSLITVSFAYDLAHRTKTPTQAVTCAAAPLV